MSRYKAKCDNCKYTKTLSSPLYSYELEDGSTINIQKTFAWCSVCSEVVWAEVIPSMENLRSERSELQAPSEKTIDYLKSLAGSHSTLEAELERLRSLLDKQIQWLESRKSPSRCLSCGATSVTLILKGLTNSGNPKWELPCPTCIGQIRVLLEPVLSLDRRWIRFNPEGLEAKSN